MTPHSMTPQSMTPQPSTPKQKIPVIFVINGPNLQLLGKRQPDLYGKTTLDELHTLCHKWAQQCQCKAQTFQNDAEHELIHIIHKAQADADAILINAAAYTHTSVAIHDALAFANKPLVEVHISPIHKRESFRHHSYISPLATGLVCGLGIFGYKTGIEFLAQHLLSETTPSKES